MTINLDDRPYIMERGKSIFFVESLKKGRRRIINLNKIEYLEFATTKLYNNSGDVFTARLQYEGARCHVFEGNDAMILLDYYVTSAEIMESQLDHQIETELIYQ